MQKLKLQPWLSETKTSDERAGTATDAYGKEARLQVGAWLVIVQIGLPAALQLQK